MSNQVLANAFLTIAALMPALASYFCAKYYFSFEVRSPQQMIVIASGLAVVLGTIFLQDWILNIFGMPIQNEYLRRLTAFQYLAAVIVFFWKLMRVQKSR